MDSWRWILAVIVLTIGWAIVLLVLRIAYAPLPRPTNPTAWDYWIVRAIILAVIVISGAAGSYVVVEQASQTVFPVTFWSLLSAFAAGSVAWIFWLLIFAAILFCGVSAWCGP